MAVLVAFKKLGHLASYAADVRWAPCQRLHASATVCAEGCIIVAAELAHLDKLGCLDARQYT